MKVSLSADSFKGTVRAIASKSMAHRYFICAALSDKPTDIICEEFSKDMEATLQCMVSLGARAEADKDGFVIYPMNKEKVCGGDESITLDCGESGSTLRFLLPVAGALGVNAEFIMHGRLSQRPLHPLDEQLKAHGCTLDKTIKDELVGILKISGKLEGGAYELPGNISSQFISGLLFALPLLESDSELKVTGALESAGYVDMTLDVIRSFFGVEIEQEQTEDAHYYRIKGSQKYVSPAQACVEGDWSGAAFWLCAAAIKGEIECTNLNMNSKQGDRRIVDILKQFGAQVDIVSNFAVRVKEAPLHGIELDAADVPDLVPVVAAVAALAEGRTVIKNAGRLRIKESDRLKAVSTSLNLLGADVTETTDGLIINGKPRLKGGQADSYADHRIAMMEAITAPKCDESVVIEGAQAVEKSYPAFYCDYIELGGRVRTAE